MKTIEAAYKGSLCSCSFSQHDCERTPVALWSVQLWELVCSWWGYLACRPIDEPFSGTLHMFGQFKQCGISETDTDNFEEFTSDVLT